MSFPPELGPTTTALPKPEGPPSKPPPPLTTPTSGILSDRSERSGISKLQLTFSSARY